MCWRSLGRRILDCNSCVTCNGVASDNETHVGRQHRVFRGAALLLQIVCMLQSGQRILLRGPKGPERQRRQRRERGSGGRRTNDEVHLRSSEHCWMVAAQVPQEATHVLCEHLAGAAACAAAAAVQIVRCVRSSAARGDNGKPSAVAR